MISSIKSADPRIIIIVFMLIAIGLLGVLSAGMSIGNFPYFYFLRQLAFIGIGGIFLLIGTAVDYRLYRFRTQTPYIATIVLLIFVFIAGEQSWLPIGMGFHLQPSEIAKLVLIAYLAYVLSFDWYSGMTFWKHSLPIMIVCVSLIIPTALQPDFGTALVMTMITGYLLLLGPVPLSHLLVPAGMAVPFAVTVPFIFPHVKVRLVNFVNLVNPLLPIEKLAHHDFYMRMSMGNGGITGRGFCGGLVKTSFLPANHTDSIFAVLVEEGGFITGTLIILLFAGLLYVGEHTARFANDRFGATLARGITFYISGQAFLNIAVCLGLFPNTGVTLPLLSYGGSSMIVTLFAIGVLINVSSQRQMLH